MPKLPSVHEQWTEFRQKCVPIECGVAELRERKIMFYGGFMAGLGSMTEALKYIQPRYIESIERELAEFTNSM
jgi:hypothetical protein